MNKKVAIIGKGTAGCLSYLTSVYHRNHKYIDIEWYYDPNKKASSVGEGSTPNLLSVFRESDLFSHSDSYSLIDARPKVGIEYINWGKKDYIHPFNAGFNGIHFNATKFQDVVFNKALLDSNVNIIDKNVKPDDLDADLVINATGYPKSLEGYITPKYIPVNAVHVTQCMWKDSPKWEHTKTIARKWGWVFVIPLVSRCSVGYLYNKDITSLESVLEDVSEVIDNLDVIPTDKTNSFHFSNYIKENIYDKNVIYTGNSGFFLEPMEATTIDSIQRSIDWMGHFLHAPNDHREEANQEMHTFFKEVEYFIMMHYAAGSKWNNEFWDFATERGKKALEEAKKSSKYSDFYNTETGYTNNKIDYSYFEPYSYKSNLEGLGLAA